MTNIPVKLLIVEDDSDIRHLILKAVVGMDLLGLEANSVSKAIQLAAKDNPSLVILDLGLSDGDGIEFIKKYRSWSTNPILVLSARLEESEKVNALDAGADDYITKPFGMAELKARIRVLLRRQTRVESNSAKFTFGDIEVDLALRKVKKNDQTVHLSPTEYRILNVMLMNAGRVVTHAQLLKEVWGEKHLENGHYSRIYMGHLRQKLEDDPSQPKFLLTETGVGYRLEI